jgi:hypothetical protein
MKTKVLLFMSALLWTVFSYAQNPTWVMAPNYLKFEWMVQQLPLPTGLAQHCHINYNGFTSEFGSGGISNLDGSLKFFVIDGLIYDGDGSYIEYAWNPSNPDTYLYQLNDTTVQAYPKGNGSDLIIIPHPTDCEKFYFIASIELIGERQTSVPFYALFDYSSKQVIKRGYWYNNADTKAPWEIPLFNMSGPTNGDTAMNGATYTELYWGKGQTTYAVTEKMSDGSRFVIGSYGGGLVILKLKSDGELTYWKRVELPAGYNYPSFFRGETEVFHNATTNITTIATTKYSYVPGVGDAATLQIMEANLETGTFLTPAKVIPLVTDYMNTKSLISGLEFSPNGRYVYFSCKSNLVNAHELYYYDRVADTVISLAVPSNVVINKGNIELDVQGNLVFSTPNGLYKLQNSNNPTLATFSPFVSMNVHGNYLTLDPGYQMNTLLAYNLPNQIDRQNYMELFSTNTLCCSDNSNYDAKSYSASSGVWNGSSPMSPGNSTITIKDELRIPAGVNLEIKNMTLRFAVGARLVIENGSGGLNGGKLTLDNTILTVDERCGNDYMWLGVEVWGNTSSAQGIPTSTSQGVFIMNNNSKIEHAEIGVLVSRRAETQDGDVIAMQLNDAYNGGIFQASNSTFFNCWYGTLFNSYSQGAVNQSKILKTSYIWDGLLKDVSKTLTAHITLMQCNKVFITASKFYQNTPSLYSNKTQWGTGILAYNSDFSVSNGCSSMFIPNASCSEANTIRSEFKNLSYGVSVLNPNSKPFTVLRNQFDNCLYGVYSGGAKNQVVSRNNFSIHSDASQDTYGVFIRTGTGYQIAENSFTSVDGITAKTYGLIIESSGEAHNEAYKNTFNKLYVGTQAQGINGKVYIAGNNSTAQGLRYHCNSFVKPIEKADIAVTSNGRIDYEQGRFGGLTEEETRNNAARNVFSYTTGGYDIFLSMGAQQVEYYHLASPSHEPLTYSTISPSHVVPHQQIWNGNPIYTNSSTCPTKFTGLVISFPLMSFHEKPLVIDSLYALIDKGNTEELLYKIANRPTETATYTDLMDASPYLSDTVLISYIQSTASNANLKDVLIKNSSLSPLVWDALKSSSRSSGLKLEMSAYQTGQSVMASLYDTIKTLEDELNEMQQLQLHAILSDTTLVSPNDTLVKYLELFRGDHYKHQLLQMYSSTRNQVKFDSLLLTMSLSKSHKTYYETVYKLDKEGNWFLVAKNDSTLLETLTYLSSIEEEEVALKAKACRDLLSLSIAKGEVLPLISSGSYMIQKNEEDITAKESIVVYPNPAKGEVFIHSSEMETASISMFDLSGKEVLSQDFSTSKFLRLDVSSVKKGTYLLRVLINNNSASTRLLVVE